MKDYSTTILQIKGITAAHEEIAAALGDEGNNFLLQLWHTLERMLDGPDDELQKLVDDLMRQGLKSPAADLFKEIGHQSLEAQPTGAVRSLKIASTGTTISSPAHASSSELRLEVTELLNHLENQLHLESMMAPSEPEEESASEFEMEEEEEDESPHKSRYLQARVETLTGEVIVGEASLQREADYEAKVFIGTRDKEWLGLSAPFKAPQPPDGSPLSLDIVFWEATVSPRAQIAQLRLFPQGNSNTVTFSFRTKADQTVFLARIAVFHGNRNLQTGLLRGWVGEGPAALTFVLDAAPQLDFVGLEDRAAGGASIIVNQDPDHGLRVLTYQNGEVSTSADSEADEGPSLEVNIESGQESSIEELQAALGRALNKITTAPENYTSLSLEGCRLLLLDFALRGSALHKHLCCHSQMGAQFDDVKYIQIVTAHGDAFFPIEYLYSGEPPEDDAKLCFGQSEATDAVGALEAGECCGAYAADKTHTICPLKFWSLSKVIERHAHLGQHTDLDSQFQLRSYPVSSRDRLLDPLRGAVLGASEEADNVAPDTVANLQSELNAVLRKQPVPLASDWESWAERVADERPTLLVLLPHHGRDSGFDFLEIGGDRRKSIQIREEHVSAPLDRQSRQIVLLIGCQTNSAKVSLESFVPAFQDAGAEIIVSTIGSILGRHAGPAAAAIVQEIKEKEGTPNATFGEVMLTVRRRLLAEGMPMVLGLTSYGDADWRFGTVDDSD